VIGAVASNQTLRPRSKLPGWPRASQKQVDVQLKLKHLYIRNPILMQIIRFRQELVGGLRAWFDGNGFTSVDAPILTLVSLYEDETAVQLELHGQPVFLTQCAGYYLEAAVHAFERVYNIGPGFRAAESESSRHLVEYWHVKAEVAWTELEDLLGMVEEMFRCIVTHAYGVVERLAPDLRVPFQPDRMLPPYERISYRQALERLEAKGISMKFGDNIQGERQLSLASDFQCPFWLVGLPAEHEPFPYQLDPDDGRLTLTADLIAPGRFGEILGVAQKIHEPETLEARMRDKGKASDSNYDFVRDVHSFGCVPHTAFGMGLERLIRWLLGLSHVRDTNAFPRLVGRRFYP